MMLQVAAREWSGRGERVGTIHPINCLFRGYLHHRESHRYGSILKGNAWQNLPQDILYI